MCFFLKSFQNNINQFFFKRILIAPLDWGLGHATRCIPIIKELQRRQIEVIIAAEGAIATLLQREFPEIKIIPLKGYNISYGKRKNLFLLKIISQLPKIWKAIQYEKYWLNDMIALHKIEAVISDNRLGFCSKKVPSFFITHQLQIKSGSFFLDKIIRHFNYYFINQFDECWIPDVESADNYAGTLSHPEVFPKIPVKYIGPLSRFKKLTQEKKYKIAIVLSGPEPQRTIFENKIINQLKDVNVSTVIVRGLPNEIQQLSLTNQQVILHNYLDAVELSDLMQQSEIVIARSGYSTIMDLVAIGQQAVLVPTPGQTEQEYLAKYLSEKGLFKTMNQSDFELKNIIKDL